MTLKKSFILSVVLGLLVPAAAMADSFVQQWKQGLSGTRLTSYSGSVISSNSTLTVISFCSNGRYHYYKEGSWSAPGAAAGASNNTISGRWDIKQQGNYIVLVYVTDSGEQGFYPIYLQQDGRVNIGGASYAVERGAAGC